MELFFFANKISFPQMLVFLSIKIVLSNTPRAALHMFQQQTTLNDNPTVK